MKIFYKSATEAGAWREKVVWRGASHTPEENAKIENFSQEIGVTSEQLMRLDSDDEVRLRALYFPVRITNLLPEEQKFVASCFKKMGVEYLPATPAGRSEKNPAGEQLRVVLGDFYIDFEKIISLVRQRKTFLTEEEGSKFLAFFDKKKVFSETEHTQFSELLWKLGVGILSKQMLEKFSHLLSLDEKTLKDFDFLGCVGSIVQSCNDRETQEVAENRAAESAQAQEDATAVEKLKREILL